MTVVVPDSRRDGGATVKTKGHNPTRFPCHLGDSHHSPNLSNDDPMESIETGDANEYRRKQPEPEPFSIGA